MNYNELTQEIITDHLLLRKFQECDATPLEAAINDEDVCKSTHALNFPLGNTWAKDWTIRQATAFDERESKFFAVTDRITGELFGFICIIIEERDFRGELGYAYGKKYWGKGIATEAAKAIIEYAFQIKNLHKVYARHFSTNPASGRVIQKCGMTYEGTQISHDFKSGKFEDVVSYGIINPTYQF